VLLIRYLMGGGALVLATAIAGSIAGGAATIALLATLVHASGSSAQPPLALFVFLAGALLAGRALSNLLVPRLSAGAGFRLRQMLTHSILAAPFDLIERIGTARLDTALVEETRIVAAALPRLVQLAVSSVIVIGGLGYLGRFSPEALLIALAITAIGVPVYWMLRKRAVELAAEIARLNQRMFANLASLANGIKELKLHQGRRAHFMSRHFMANLAELRHHHNVASTLTAAGSLWGQSLTLAIVGLLIYVEPAAPASLASRAAIMVLYLMVPLEQLIVSAAGLADGNRALHRVKELIAQLGTEPYRQPVAATPGKIEEIRFKDITFRYGQTGDEKGFALGPISLMLRPGVVTFLTGGNGSGKTTLVKLIVGLYWPDGGEITIDGQPICSSDREQLRSLFTAVFDDYHLFEEVLPNRQSADLANLTSILDRFKLSGKTNVGKDGRVTNLKLSRGQRKRLALVNATLEDRPILVLDEWAADQDPYFRALFYCQILPELRAAGKAVLVISHDEQYFDAADEMIVLQDGTISRSSTLPGAAGAVSAAASRRGLTRAS
jgi:putative ATP-binding cassette transporter